MNDAVKHYIKRFLAGMMMGIGGILPGVSGSVLAIAFGLYEPILDAVATIFKNFKENLKLLLPVGLGGVVGFFVVAMVLNKLLENHQTGLIFMFCGLIAGSMPALVREAHRAGGKLKKRHIVAMAAGFALSMLLLMVQQEEGVGADAAIGPWQAMATGALITAGSILPGLSTSFIMFRLGWYRPMMAAVTSVDVIMLAWTGLGIIVAAVCLVSLMRMLLKKYPGTMYHLVIGLMVGSMIASLPHVPVTAASLIYILPFAGGAAVAYLMSKFES